MITTLAASSHLIKIISINNLVNSEINNIPIEHTNITLVEKRSVP